MISEVPYYAAPGALDFEISGGVTQCGSSEVLWALKDEKIGLSSVLTVVSQGLIAASSDTTLSEDLECGNLPVSSASLTGNFRLDGNGHIISMTRSEPFILNSNGFDVTIENVEVDLDLSCAGAPTCVGLVQTLSAGSTLTLKNVTLNVNIASSIILPTSLFSGLVGSVSGSVVMTDCQVIVSGQTGSRPISGLANRLTSGSSVDISGSELVVVQNGTGSGISAVALTTSGSSITIADSIISATSSSLNYANTAAISVKTIISDISISTSVISVTTDVALNQGAVSAVVEGSSVDIMDSEVCMHFFVKQIFCCFGIWFYDLYLRFHPSPYSTYDMILGSVGRASLRFKKTGKYR